MYASPVWGLSMSNIKLKRIQVLQNKILRIDVSAQWFIRNNNLHQELGVNKIEEYIKNCCDTFLDSLEVPEHLHST